MGVVVVYGEIFGRALTALTQKGPYARNTASKAKCDVIGH